MEHETLPVWVYATLDVVLILLEMVFAFLPFSWLIVNDWSTDVGFTILNLGLVVLWVCILFSTLQDTYQLLGD